jgi:phosphate transport system protein
MPVLRTRESFDEQLGQLQQRLLQFGSFVEAMLERAVRALVEQDVVLAQEVVNADDTADDMDLDIEQQCMKLLALQQPMSRDLRAIGTTMKVISDIERIGDYSVDIARIAIKLSGSDYFKPLVDIPRMAELVRRMLRRSIEGMVAGDLDVEYQVVAMDDEVDETWRRLYGQLVAIMQQQPEVVPVAVPLLLVARYLERIADHVENIAERVGYMETGRLEELKAHNGTPGSPPSL